MPLGTMIALGATISAFGSAFKGISNMISKSKQRAATRAEIQNQIKQGEADLADYEETLLDSYNKAMASLEDSRKSTQTSLGYTQTQRASDANTAAAVNLKSQELGYQELAQMLASNEQTVGSAVSNTAKTGFRNTGTNKNYVNEVQRQVTQNAAMALDKVKLSAAQSYYQAASNYLSQSASIESYKQNLDTIARNMEETTTTYSINKRQAEDKWAQKKDYLQQQYDAANEQWYSGLLDFSEVALPEFASIASSGIKTAVTAGLA